MAEFLWTFAVQEVLKKVAKVAAEQIGLAWGLKKELHELREWLLKTETFLRDINKRKLHHDSVRLWVDKLQHLVHEAEHLLDELVYEDLRRKVVTGKMKKVRDFVSPSNNILAFRVKMARKMKNITDLLCKHYCEAGPLGLVGDGSAEIEIDIAQLRETISELDDFEVVGRDVEVSKIVNQLIDATNTHVTSILPIVGMGGLGKTTMAKVVFNHERIKTHFDKTIWVCVSEPFLVNKILGAILGTLRGTSSGLDNKEALLHELKKEMHGKRYFLVLDDVWNESHSLWDELKNCLMRITERSENSILVTTRSAEVAKIMETLPNHHLSKLSDDQCWSLFLESANVNGLSITSSLKVVQELVKKIGGIPLVARVLGRAVKFEGDYETWVTTLESIIRTRLQLQEESFVLSILKLSVDRLPLSSLKQCFSYCSNFPKDFVFEKEPLIRMWMAQGFIQLQERRSNKTMEDEGDTYFKILLSRCLFQDIIKDGKGRIISFKMHDLIHDIACNISNDKKLHLDPCNLLDNEHWRNEISEKVASKLRTVICRRETLHRREQVIDDKMSNFIWLRVLIINFWNAKKLPDSIGKLKHLRYLDISGCSMDELPESIVSLYHLQTLRIEGTMIVDLPKNLGKLVSLRHLEFSFFLGIKKILQMPSHLSQLVQLQTLSTFIVGFEKGRKITELGPLKNLKGSLNLSNLERIKSKEEAMFAKLGEKENLHELTFTWTCSSEREYNNHNDLDVLEGLQPHKSLQSLSIQSFLGECLPNKIFVENLVAISLVDCENCERLPMLGQLTNLEELCISGLHSVRSIGNEFYGNDSDQRTFFPKLKKFTLNKMSNLEQWEEVTLAPNLTVFPCIEMWKISECFKLLKVPKIFGSWDKNHVKPWTLVLGNVSN
ncbi:putative disease resistance protein RGA3 [Momordica charantia]|uniref:Disease resistance protein RGA3 n=1 Tax=Momordica charantia TaxID=3673 RepID=A0A6J1DXY1_MOMCH|nr:putative disease resistance protein RGA3 [Momordica charantia]